jgi:hypothetical protein
MLVPHCSYIHNTSPTPFNPGRGVAPFWG